jgi:hypothetical protein
MSFPSFKCITDTILQGKMNDLKVDFFGILNLKASSIVGIQKFKISQFSVYCRYDLI